LFFERPTKNCRTLKKKITVWTLKQCARHQKNKPDHSWSQQKCCLIFHPSIEDDRKDQRKDQKPTLNHSLVQKDWSVKNIAWHEYRITKTSTSKNTVKRFLKTHWS